MSGENLGKRITGIAGADLSGSRYCAVTTDANGAIILPAAGGKIIGVVQLNPKVGETSAVAIDAVSYGVAAAAYVGNAELAVDAAGNFVTAVATNAIVAKALEASGGAGEIHPVLIGYRGVQA